ncbi:hypothetical protein AXF19_10900 [Selenomonas sp. oral taxon 126]|nr:hypothetical protein AXF19_10900 [Selenomonas sp. oral taxon 126]
MRGNLAYTAVVLHVMQETECLFTKYGSKLLLFLDFRLVEDFTEFVERVCCVTAEGGDVLRGILTDVDGSRCDGSFCGAVCIAFCGGCKGILLVC